MLAQKYNPKILIGVIGAVIVIVALVMYTWLFSTENEPLPAHELDISAVQSTPSAQSTTTDQAAVTETAETTTTPLIDESVLQSPVSENASLAKEELAKLEDLQVQLQEQETTLNTQHQDADQILALKEEQIKILEAQIAQAQ